MKKVVLVIITLVLSLSSMACINPSMENGFEKLNQSLSELVASFDAVNIPQITSDMEQITDDLESIVVGIENYVSAVEEYNQAILIYNEALLEYNDAMMEYDEALTATNDFLSQIDSSIEGMLQALEGLREMKEEGNEWAGIFLQIAEIRIGLQDILAIMKTKATKEQMEALLAQVQEMGEGVDQLVFLADYDYDGVINGIDKCPDTPLSDINNVNAQGCAPGQTPVTEGD
jgi:chromosome segregation ATPase|tara:strand:- start:565 stop:1257 length:693 start_codon:yes stop_codon:yes gene_type:complete